MAQKIYVYADFEWLKETELAGTLSYERLRGSDSIGFDEFQFIGCQTFHIFHPD